MQGWMHRSQVRAPPMCLHAVSRQCYQSYTCSKALWLYVVGPDLKCLYDVQGGVRRAPYLNFDAQLLQPPISGYIEVGSPSRCFS